MKLRLINILFGFLFVSTIIAQNDPVIIDTELDSFIRLERVRVLHDGNHTLQNLDFNKSEWQDVQLGTNTNKHLSSVPGIVWLTVELRITETFGFDKELALNLINIGSANEVYWDNFLIGQKGSIENSASAEPEQIVQVLKIPYDFAKKGNHRLLVKLYNSPAQTNQLMSSINIGFNTFFMGRQIERNYMKIFFMSILFASAIFFIILFFGFNKNIAYLFFSIYCLAGSFKSYFLPYWLFESSYSAIDYSNPIISVAMYILSYLALILFLVIKFSIHKSHKLISAALILALFVFPLIGELWHYNLLRGIIFGIPLYAVIKRKPGSINILVGVSGFLLISYLGGIGYIWYGHNIGILFLVISVSILASVEIAEQYRNHREAVLRAVRLENELLKRNIQPHFILNTLASLEGVIEQDPKLASKFIHSLAEEFQMFSKVSGEKLIPLSDEIKMCRAHLEIMKFRKGVKFDFNTHGINGNESVPPGIFHTLTENGTTHGYIKKKKGIFNLTKENKIGFIRYIFFNDSENTEMKEEINKGTGYKYIEARLEESYPGLWKLQSDYKYNGWEVVIDIYDNDRNKK